MSDNIKFVTFFMVFMRKFLKRFSVIAWSFREFSTIAMNLVLVLNLYLYFKFIYIFLNP